MKRLLGTVGALMLLVLAGCGGGVQQAQPRRTTPSITGGYGYTSSFAASSVKPAEQVQVVEANYYGRRALKMTNGLVTIIAVPELGGRIMEYKLGSKSLLWANIGELERSSSLGPAAPAPAERKWRNWGGYKVWPAPQERWGGPPDPPGSRLDGGPWVGRIVKPRGERGEIELVSPADKSVTGLQITRRVIMYKGTTHVRVEETFKNVSGEEIQWSIWGIAQVPGALSPEEKFSEDARVYFPLNPHSRFTGGYRTIIERPSDQWRVIDGDIMEVSYKSELGKIGADSTAGWIAYLDDRHDFAFVQRFNVQAGAEYPDGGCTVEVFTSHKLPYMEVEVLSPLYKIAPGAEVSFSTDWYATRVPGSIRDVTEVAAVNKPPKLESKGSQRLLTATLGVFQPGTLTITPLDADGKTVGRPIKKSVSPTAVVSLKEKLPPAAKGAAKVVVELTSDQRSYSLASLAIAKQK